VFKRAKTFHPLDRATIVTGTSSPLWQYSIQHVMPPGKNVKHTLFIPFLSFSCIKSVNRDFADFCVGLRLFHFILLYPIGDFGDTV
jgi:hypothetical protein